MSVIDIQHELNNTSAQICEELKKIYPEPDEDFAVVSNAEQYSLLAGGKRIRPFLVLRFCELFGGKAEDALPLACAVEMVHTYSLIHDDLPCMDDDTLRRGKPTCHVAFGEANALLAGDALLTKAFETVTTAHWLPAEIRIAAVGELAKAAGDRGMIAGQIMDLRAENEPIPFETLLKLHSLKTGALIHVSCLLGALAAGVLPDDPRMRAVTEYSRNIGIAFQVVDDILDATGDEKTLGKPIGSDAAKGKTTFLSFMTEEEAERYAVELTESAVSAISDYDKTGVLSSLAYYLCNRKF